METGFVKYLVDQFFFRLRLRFNSFFWVSLLVGVVSELVLSDADTFVIAGIVFSALLVLFILVFALEMYLINRKPAHPEAKTGDVSADSTFDQKLIKDIADTSDSAIVANSVRTHQSPTQSTHLAGNSVLDELERLASLKERGFLTDEEFSSQKAKLIS